MSPQTLMDFDVQEISLDLLSSGQLALVVSKLYPGPQDPFIELEARTLFAERRTEFERGEHGSWGWAGFGELRTTGLIRSLWCRRATELPFWKDQRTTFVPAQLFRGRVGSYLLAASEGKQLGPPQRGRRRV